MSKIQTKLFGFRTENFVWNRSTKNFGFWHCRKSVCSNFRHSLYVVTLIIVKYVCNRVYVTQEVLIREVMRDVGLDADSVASTKTFINSSDDNTSSLGGYKFSQGYLIGMPNYMNYSSTKVFIQYKFLSWLVKWETKKKEPFTEATWHSNALNIVPN